MSEVCCALVNAGYESVALQVEEGKIERCSYDDDADAGYVDLVRPELSAHFANLASLVAKTIPFLDGGFNVDLDHDGNVIGVEFLNRSDFARELRDAGVL